MYEFLFYLFGLINIVVVGILSIFYYPQAIYFLRSLFPPKRFKDAKEENRYCFLIPAKNEENVICGLIDSIRKQTYPSELLDIFVVADNCTDCTAARASDLGAIVFERNDPDTIGKGYGLKLGISRILNEYADKNYKGIFFFDADNLLASDYVSQMNKAIESGETLLTSYRNAKNFGESATASCSGLIFARENRIVHMGRNSVGASTLIAGTGFYADLEVFKESGGWDWYLLTEDLEFSLEQIMKGRKITFVYDAVFYDEQPKRFSDSWHQRVRWLKGANECYSKDKKRLTKGLFSDKFASCLEGLAFAGPWPFLITVWTVLYHIAITTLCIISYSANPWLLQMYLIMLGFIIGGYLTAGVLFASYLLIKERKRIKGTFCQKLKSILFFPFFVFSFVPIVFAARYGKRQWKTITHSYNVTIDDINKNKK